ncbi:hypothetical protein BACI348_40096 [Bacillus altitudinis]|uniref:Uncharacterized protein n=1 Tax=Bacillus altitudinis TaxID=293387 RepID=A0A653NLN2_BACAB|nr:hypothetical protein BACI348_40096 [Bacillus altitudinis]
MLFQGHMQHHKDLQTCYVSFLSVITDMDRRTPLHYNKLWLSFHIYTINSSKFLDLALE